MLDGALQLYRQERYLEAIDYINRHAHEVQGNMAQIYNFLYSLESKAGKINLALATFQEAVEEKGIWYSANYLRSDPDLDPLRTFEMFDRLVEICREREEAAKKNSRPQLKVVSPPHPAGGVVISLHGNQDNIDITEPYWREVVELGWTLALPQSSTIDLSDAYVWRDHEKGIKELGEHYRNLMREHPVPPEKVVLGGFSAGCQVALGAVLSGEARAKALLLMGPYLPNIEEWSVRLEALRAQGTKVHIVIGERDEDCLPGARRLAALLEEKGLPYSMRLIPGLVHDYADDFGADIRAAIEDP